MPKQFIAYSSSMSRRHDSFRGKQEEVGCLRGTDTIGTLTLSRVNCTVVVATQNPRVSTSLPYRSLLLTTLALRLNSKSEAVMAMGEDAVRRGARPWQIPFNRPGDGYLWDAETNQVRYLHVPFVTDEEIHALHRVGGDGDGRSGSDSPVPATPSFSGHRGYYDAPC